MRLLRTVALALGLGGAFLASQLPEFLQQYSQRLGGAIDELTQIVARFDADAAANEMTRQGALARLAQSPDDIARRRAEDAQTNIGRLESLEAQRRLMSEAPPLTRVAYFFRYADTDVARAAMRDFEPAVPTTGEGVLTAGAGFLGGWGIVYLVSWPWRRWRELRLKQRSSR